MVGKLINRPHIAINDPTNRKITLNHNINRRIVKFYVIYQF